MKKTFVLALAFPIVYQLLWFGFKYVGMQWPTLWNVPGFLFIVASKPWSLPFTLSDMPMQLSSFAICVGFAINTTILVVVCKWLLRQSR